MKFVSILLADLTFRVALIYATYFAAEYVTREVSRESAVSISMIMGMFVLIIFYSFRIEARG